MEENINEKKEYTINDNNVSYKLIITRDKEYLNFELKNEDIEFFYYHQKFNYNDLNKIIKVNIYDNLEKILEVINEAYAHNKISLLPENKNIKIIIKHPIGYKEYEFPLTLKQKEFGINEKFTSLFNEINSLKNNKNIVMSKKIIEIEELLHNLQNEIDEKFSGDMEIKSKLKKKLETNQNLLKENGKILELLKEEIKNQKNNFSKLKKEIENKRNTFGKNINEVKKQINLYISNNKEIFHDHSLDTSPKDNLRKRKDYKKNDSCCIRKPVYHNYNIQNNFIHNENHNCQPNHNKSCNKVIPRLIVDNNNIDNRPSLIINNIQIEKIDDNNYKENQLFQNVKKNEKNCIKISNIVKKNVANKRAEIKPIIKAKLKENIAKVTKISSFRCNHFKDKKKENIDKFKLAQFREEFGLSINDYTDDLVLKSLKENNFDFNKAFESLINYIYINQFSNYRL